MVTLASPFETDAPRTGFSRHDSRRIAKSAQRFRGALTYDVKGNLVARPASLQSPALSLVWDFDNKLKGADTNGTPATLEVTYEYDALGRRVARSGPGGNVVYFQAGQQTIADYPRGGVPASATYRYVYGAYIDEPLLRETVSGSVRHFFHRNQQYSVTALTDSAGNTAERYAYTAYGALTVFNSSGIPQATSPLNNRYTYTGREWDDSTKLYHFRARWYDPAAGRFVGRDPLGFVDGMGLYFASMRAVSKGAYAQTKQEENKKEAVFVGPFDHTKSKVKKCVFYANGFGNPSNGSADIYERFDDTVVFPYSTEQTKDGLVVTDSLDATVKIAKFIEKHKCCELLLLGHQGGYGNPGGVAAKTKNGEISVLPGTLADRTAIRQALLNAGCESCSIFLYSCGDTRPELKYRPQPGEDGYGEYQEYKAKREANRWTIAEDTGCDVYGLRRLQSRYPPKNYTNGEIKKSGTYLDFFEINPIDHDRTHWGTKCGTGEKKCSVIGPPLYKYSPTTPIKAKK